MLGLIGEMHQGKDPLLMSTSILAFLGDCVYELYVRNMAIDRGSPKVNELNRVSSSFAKASFQAAAIKRLDASLSEAERDVVRRARNKRVTSKAKNANLTDYKMATAFEALVGYLYLEKKMERLEWLMKEALEQEDL